MKHFSRFLIIYGLAMSTYFGVWSFKDYFALEDAVRLKAPHAELRHRINVGFEGVWYLLSNFIVIAGVAMSSQNKKSDSRQ